MAAQRRSITVNGVTLQVFTAGQANAPLVILLHGFPETARAWDKFVDPIVDIGWRVAIPDQRGYAQSDKPQRVSDYALDVLADDICDLASALKAERFAVVGHDWGGIVAWHLAARNPELVERLVILNAPHPAGLLGYAMAHPLQLARSAYVGFFQVPLLPEVVLSANDFSLLSAALTRSSKPGTFDSATLEAYRQAWRAPRALRSMLNWYRAMGLARPISTPIEVPTLVLWGDQDSALEPGLADKGLSYCRKGRLTRLPDATHWLHHEQTERVSTLMCDFLREMGARDRQGSR